MRLEKLLEKAIQGLLRHSSEDFVKKTFEGVLSKTEERNTKRGQEQGPRGKQRWRRGEQAEQGFNVERHEEQGQQQWQQQWQQSRRQIAAREQQQEHDVEAEKTAEAKRKAAEKGFKKTQRRKLTKEKEEAKRIIDERALQVQMKELPQQVEGLKVQRIRADQEMKLQRSWMEGELRQRVMVAQVEERMGALEVGSMEQGCVLQLQQMDQRMETQMEKAMQGLYCNAQAMIS